MNLLLKLIDWLLFTILVLAASCLLWHLLRRLVYLWLLWVRLLRS